MSKRPSWNKPCLCTHDWFDHYWDPQTGKTNGKCAKCGCSKFDDNYDDMEWVKTLQP